MLKEKLKVSSEILYKIAGLLVYLIILTIVQYHYVFDLWNPSWGDMVSIPLEPIPFKNILLLWFEQFSGSFGMVNIPQFILSQFTRFVSPHILQLIYINFNYLVLYWGIYSVLTRFNIKSLKAKTYATLLFSLLYTFSSVNIANYSQGQFETSIVYTFAMLMGFYLYFLFRDKRFSDLLVLFFLLLISTWYNWLSIFYIGLFLFPEFLVLSIRGFYQGRLKIKEYLLAILIFAGLFLLANLNIIYQLYFNLFSAVNFTAATLSSLDSGIKNEINYMYANSTVLNSLYNTGNKGDITNIYFDYQSRFLDVDYTVYTILGISNVLVIIFCFLYFYKNRHKKIKNIDFLIYTYFIYFLGIILVSYVFYLQKGSSIIENLPFISIYRNPKKFMLSEFMSLLMIYILFFIKFKNKKKYLVVLLFLVLANFLAKFQFLTSGYLGKDLQYETNKITSIDSYHTVFVNESSYPKYFSELKEFTSKHNLSSTERIIVIPNNSQTLYESFLRYEFPLFHIPANANILSGGDVNSSLISVLYNDIVAMSDFSNILKIGNIKYVVVDRKGPYYLWNYTESIKVREFGSIWLWGRPESVNRRLSSQPALKMVAETDNFYIYEFINHTDQIVYIPNKVSANTSLAENQNILDTTDLYISDDDFKIQLRNNIAKITDIKKISSTEYEFNLSAQGPGEIPIYFSQKFSPSWKLELAKENGEPIEGIKHSIGNGFGNVWFADIPEAGLYRVRIILTIQKTNEIFTYIAITTVIVLITMMFIVRYRSIKK